MIIIQLFSILSLCKNGEGNLYHLMGTRVYFRQASKAVRFNEKTKYEIRHCSKKNYYDKQSVVLSRAFVRTRVSSGAL